MNKKKYIAPDLDLLILEQSDIITVSGGTGGEYGGEEDPFGNVGGFFNGDWQ